MKPSMVPFNVTIMDTSPERLRLMRPVTALDYFENVSGEFHDDGLFSVSIFGRVGDEARDRRFSFIDIKVDIFHPVIYDRLVSLRSLYRDLMAGKAYATWNAELGDFESSNEVDGQTGYAFFAQHWRDIKFQRNRSDIRAMRIDLIEKFKDRAMTSKILVMPAGLRDIEVDQSGNMKEGDINALYRRILSIANTVAATDNRNVSSAVDNARQMLQLTFNELYESVEKMLTGKKGFLQDKWASRRVFDGTRNVITAMDHSVEELGAVNAPRFTDAIVGLRQLSRAVLPVTNYLLLNGYMKDVFSHGNGSARLIDPVTLRPEIVQVSAMSYDRWNSEEGLQKVVSSYGEASLRNKPVMIEGRYAALIYTGPDGTFRVFHDIEQLPEDRSRDHVRPINLMELLYLSGYRRWNTFCGYITRYPVTGLGSCYATTLYVKTTVVGEVRRELGEDWQPLGDAYVAPEFPTYSPLAYMDSLSIPAVRLAGLGADFDGDTASLNVLYTDEAEAEVRAYLNSRAAYYDPIDGERASIDTDTLNLVLKAMSGAPREPA